MTPETSVIRMAESGPQVFTQQDGEKVLAGLSHWRPRKMWFPGAAIFNGLTPSKMAAHPCAARRVARNAFSHHPVRPRFLCVAS
jgi:hypothetical protein